MRTSLHRIYIQQRRLIIGAAFLFISVFLVWSVFVWSAALGLHGKTAVSGQSPTAVPDAATSTVERFIDGARVDPEMASGTLFAVMIDNTAEAQPSAGLENAPLVVEASAEGGISRLLAFFLTGESVPAIGPVRSARPYFMDLARMYDALYVHVGGSPAALDALIGALWNVDEYSKGQYFWRSGKRSAPHNVFTSTDEMAQAARKRGTSVSYAPIWFFEDGASPADRGEGSVLAINFGVTNAEWRYDKQNNVYARSVYGAPDTTIDHNQITAANVVVASMQVQSIDTDGRLDIKTAGSGTALFLQNGKSINGTWQRLSADAPLKFFDANGNEMRLTRGTTWIEVVGGGVTWSNN